MNSEITSPVTEFNEHDDVKHKTNIISQRKNLK